MDIAYSYLQAVFLVKSEQEWDKAREIMVQKNDLYPGPRNPDGQMKPRWTDAEGQTTLN